MSRSHIIGLGLAAGLAFACGGSNTFAPPPPPPVTVARPQIDEIVDYLEFTGTTASSGCLLYTSDAADE